jgi:hypothetical protein
VAVSKLLLVINHPPAYIVCAFCTKILLVAIQDSQKQAGSGGVIHVELHND